MATGDEEQASANARLIAAMKKLDVFSRVDGQGVLPSLRTLTSTFADGTPTPFSCTHGRGWLQGSGSVSFNDVQAAFGTGRRQTV